MWDLLTRIGIILSAVIIIIFIYKKYYIKYYFFMYYFIGVYATDIFGYLSKQLGWGYHDSTYTTIMWVSIFGHHILKIFVIFGLYKLFLKGYSALKAIMDVLFYGIIILIMLLYLFSFNISSSFFYNIGIHFGEWAFLLMATISTLILICMKICGIRVERTYLFILLGFLIYSLTQCLNFFLLSKHYEVLSQYWAAIYKFSYLLPLSFWLIAAFVREEESISYKHPVYVDVKDDLVTRMETLDQLSANILGKLFPFWSRPKTRPQSVDNE